MQLNQTHGLLHGPVKRNKGYTLVEVLCAIVVAAITAAALFVGFDNGFALLRTTREDLRATQILMQKTEAVRLLRWDQVNSLTASQGRFQEYYYDTSGNLTTNAGTLFFGYFSVSNVPNNIIPTSVSYNTNLQLITVTLNWTNNIGSTVVPHSRSMQTLYFAKGLRNYVYGKEN